MHCNREYHIGETCGMRLVNNTIEQLERCKYCQKADTKLRKREAEANRVVRWQREGRDSASIQRRMDIIRKLDAEISQIYSQIARFRTTPGGHVQHPLKCGEDPSAGQSDGPVVMEMGAKLARKISTAKEHFGLPVTFGALESPLTFMSCPDTGSYVNAISLELASYLGLSVEFSEMELQMRTQLANGKWISSCGHIIAACTLDSLVPDTYFTIIYVFQTLASPGLFFGKQFLEESQARARNLLRKLPWYSSIPRVRSTGSPMHLLSCSLNGIPIGVFPDTGSEVDLMSQEYAEKHFKLEPTPRDTKVEYADGSIEEVFWVVRADLAVGFEPPVYERPREMKVQLENTVEIILAQRV
jgi:hypothetical protein